MATRRERVILELEDLFTGPTIKAAAAAALLDKSLDHLSGQAVQSSKTTRQIDKDVDSLGKTSKRTEKDIDKLSGRLRILAEVAAIVGPSLAPIGAVGVAAISGIASELGFAAVGAGVAVLAFQGVSDALKALNKAELEPTAKNIEDARRAMERLSPAAREFTKHLEAMKPALKELRDMAATGLLPGLSEGLDGLESALPRVEKIITAISTELGSIGADAGKSIGSDRWAPFLDFIAKEGPSALGDFATAAGNTAHALAGLWMSTDPLNDDFSQWLVKATADLDRWANGLGQTQGFADFLAYVEETGPQVAATFGALADAALQIVEASAPLGGPVLKSLEALANIISAIADSDLGTPIFTGIAALSLFNRTLAITKRLQESALGTLILKQREANKGFATMDLSARGLGKAAVGIGGVALATIAVVDAWEDFNKNIDNAKSATAARDIEGLTTALSGLHSQLYDLNHQDGIWDFLSDAKDQVIGGDLTNKLNFLPVVGPYLQELTGGGKTAADRLGEAADQSTRALADLHAEQRDQAAAAAMRDGLVLTARGLDTATQSADEFTASIQRAKDVLSSQASYDAYEASLDRFTAGLKENGKTLDANTEKGRSNRANLRDIASTAIDFADTLKGIDRTRFLDHARAQFIKARVAAGDTRAAAKKLADQIGLLNQVKGTPKINSSQIDNAITKANTLRGLLQDIGVAKIVPPDLFNKLFPDGTGADGATVPKTGKPYADRHLWLVADGERIVSNRYGQVDRHAGLLDAIENDRFASNGASPGRTPSGLGAYINRDLDMKFPHTLKAWNVALSASTTLLEKEKNKRQDLLDQADQVRSAITSGYKSDLFGQTTPSVWMSTADRMKAGKGDVFSTLTGDIGNLNALKAATGQLKAKGLDGAALADLLSNAPLSEVQAFASGSKADALRYENLYNQRASLLVGVGNTGASAAFGPQLAASKAQVAATAAFTRAIDRLDGRVDGVVKALHAVGVKRPRK